MIKFKCPHCGKDVSAGDEHAGKKGRCPGCKELFTIPAAAKPAPAAERRTPPPADEDEAPRKKKKSADYDPDDPEAVEELKRRLGVKIVKRKPDEEDDEAPRKKKPARDDEDDEAIAEAPRKKRPARDEDDEDDRPRKKRRRDDDDDEEDEPRARKKRGRDDDEEDEDDRPRKKKKKRRGEHADCPKCGCRGDATPVSFTWWGGILGPRLFSHVKCNRCGTCYNGKTGEYNTTKIAIYVVVGSVIALVLVALAVIANSK